MLYTLISIKDRSVDAYQPCQAVRSEGEAIRSFQDAINNPESGVMHRHPDDFDLYAIGTFDDSNAQLNYGEPRKIADGKQLSMKGA